MADKVDALSSRKIFYFALFSVSSMTVLGGTVISPSLPNLENHFSYINNIHTLSKLVLTISSLFIMIFSPLSGFIYDRCNRLKIMLPSIIIWSLSGASGFLLDNINLILISRMIFGIATAFVMTGASSLISDYYHGERRDKALSLQGFYTAFGGAIFLILGGVLSHIDWRYPFLVYLLGFVIFIFASIILFEPKKTHHLNLHKTKFNFFHFFHIYLMAFIAMAMFYIIPTQVPFFITDFLHANNALVGVFLAISSVFFAFSSLFYMKFRSYMGFRGLYFLCFCVMGAAFICIGIFHNYFILCISLALIGSSLGLLLVTNSSWLFSLASSDTKAKAYGFLVSFVFMGQFLSPLISQPLVNNFGLVNMFIYIGGFLLLFSFLVFLFLKN